MSFCTNCGNQLREGAKFCDNCGFQVGTHDDGAIRQTVFEGKIHKCPNCGEIVEAFQDDCPACGYQFRDTTVTSSVKELVDKLQEIENEPKRLNVVEYFLSNGLSQKVRKQVSLINNYTIPNTYEDIWEFLILSSSRIKNNNTAVIPTPDIRALSSAWKAKFDQAYHKAMLVIDTPEDIERIKDLYSRTKAEEAKAQRKLTKNIAIPVAVLFSLPIVLFVALIILLGSMGSGYDKGVTKESERLNTIVDEVYDYIDQGNYTMARIKAASLSFNFTSEWSSDYEAVAKKWDKTREDLLEIIDEAEQESKKQVNTGGK